ncbi:MAG: TIGR04454 family lipoprotein [Leptospiraceae bacterium]|nr:TIGR04454 family lipoprotein [Leptospiraceae bacterium]
MKKYLSSLVILILAISCAQISSMIPAGAGDPKSLVSKLGKSGSSVTPEQCAPTVQIMLQNFKKQNPNTTASEQQMLAPILQKECESGKYNVDCMKLAKTTEELQLCKK